MSSLLFSSLIELLKEFMALGDPGSAETAASPFIYPALISPPAINGAILPSF